MPLRTRARISSSSASVGARSAIPSTCRRTQLWPTDRKAFTPMPSSVHWASRSATWAEPPPSSPSATVVMPWKRKARPSRPWSASSSACECMSMKPGATTSPRASTVSSAVMPAFAASPRKRMRSPATATSAALASLPEPSITEPPRMRMSAGPPPAVQAASGRARRGKHRIARIQGMDRAVWREGPGRTARTFIGIFSRAGVPFHRCPARASQPYAASSSRVRDGRPGPGSGGSVDIRATNRLG